jgi:hypothetical protein
LHPPYINPVIFLVRSQPLDENNLSLINQSTAQVNDRKEPTMANTEQATQATRRARLRNSTTVFLVGNIEPTMKWQRVRASEIPEYL